MASQDLEVSQFKSVLDFGCGCGRILAHYVPLAGSIAFCGTDIDEAMIDWCREHIPGMDFSVNGALPPLRWPDGQFDFVLAISVFTHCHGRCRLIGSRSSGACCAPAAMPSPRPM